MKKLFVLVLVLAISTMATAASVDLQIIAGPDAQGIDPTSGAPSYLPSDTITIALVAAGFGTGADTGVGKMTIGSATTTNDGTASSPDLHTKLKDVYMLGTVVNSGGVLITDVSGSLGLYDYVGIDAGNLWWFEFHVPELEYSEIISIDLTDLVIQNKFLGGLTYTCGGALEIHVVPEPMTIALLGIGGLFLRRRK